MNNSVDLFGLALGVNTPWFVGKVDFINKGTKEELHISIDFARGATFKDANGAACKVHDTVEKVWRHLSFFQYDCYITCRVPRIKTSDGKVELITTPWARKNSGFSLLFESCVMALIGREMTIKKVAETLGINDKSIWVIFNYWIKKAKQTQDQSRVSKIGIDETSTKKGHNYVTVGVDLEEKRVICATEGKDSKAIGKIKDRLVEQGGNPDKIDQVSIDMSPAFIKGVTTEFKSASITFDKFHVVKLLNQAMDDVRKAERKDFKCLKGHKYTVLKNKEKLTANKRQQLDEILSACPKLGEAYRLKELFKELWECKNEAEAYAFINAWSRQVESKQLSPFMKFVKTLRVHKKRIANIITSGITNAILEGMNCKIQLAKRRARGYRNIDNMINMIYFLLGKLKFDYPLNYA